MEPLSKDLYELRDLAKLFSGDDVSSAKILETTNEKLQEWINSLEQANVPNSVKDDVLKKLKNAKSLLYPDNFILMESLSVEDKISHLINTYVSNNIDDASYNKLFKLLNQIKIGLSYNENNEANQNDVFNKSITIDKLITDIYTSHKVEDNKNHDLINLYNNIILCLRKYQGEINQYLYTDRFPIHDDKRNILGKLKSLINVDAGQSEDIQTLTDFIAATKESIKPIQSNHRLTTKSNIQNKIANVLANEKKSYHNKSALIKKQINRHKPAWWQFWRSKERKEYESLNRTAQLLCIVEALSKGEIDMISFSLALKDLANIFPKDKSTEIIRLSKAIMHSYKEQVNSSNDKTNATLALKNELTSTANLFREFFPKGGPKHSANLKEAYKALKKYEQIEKPSVNDTVNPENDLIECVSKTRRLLHRY